MQKKLLRLRPLSYNQQPARKRSALHRPKQTHPHATHLGCFVCPQMFGPHTPNALHKRCALPKPGGDLIWMIGNETGGVRPN